MKLPDTDISPLMWIMLDDGIGAVHASTVMAVLPDTNAPKTKALLITTVFPEGLTVKGTAMSVLLYWWETIEGANEGLEEEGEPFDGFDPDDFTHTDLGTLLAEHFAVELADVEDEVLEGLKLVPKGEGDAGDS